MHMDWNWPTPAAMWEQHKADKTEYEFNWPVGSFGLRRRPIRQWHWARIFIWLYIVAFWLLVFGLAVKFWP